MRGPDERTGPPSRALHSPRPPAPAQAPRPPRNHGPRHRERHRARPRQYSLLTPRPHRSGTPSTRRRGRRVKARRPRRSRRWTRSTSARRPSSRVAASHPRPRMCQRPKRFERAVHRQRATCPATARDASSVAVGHECGICGIRPPMLWPAPEPAGTFVDLPAVSQLCTNSRADAWAGPVEPSGSLPHRRAPLTDRHPWNRPPVEHLAAPPRATDRRQWNRLALMEHPAAPPRAMRSPKSR